LAARGFGTRYPHNSEKVQCRFTHSSAI
jgi:2-methylcitrate dehydratase